MTCEQLIRRVLNSSNFVQQRSAESMSFLHNEGILVQLDELDELTIPFTVSHKRRKYFSVMVRVADC